MKHVTVTNQREYEVLQDFEEQTEIIIDAKETILELKNVPKNGIVTLTGVTVVDWLYCTVNVMWGNSQVNVMWGSSQVNVMWGSSQVNVMRENSQVKEMWGNSQVKEMRGSSQVKEMRGNSQVNVMWGNSQVKEMREDSQVKEMWESSQVNVMRGSSQVKEMRGSSQVNVMWGNSQVKEMRENSQVKEMWESSQVNVMWGSSQVKEMWGSSQVNVMRGSSQVKGAFENALLKSCSSTVTISRLKHHSTLVCQDCNVKIDEKDDTANVVITKTMQHSKQSFVDIYGRKGRKTVTLYKSVDPVTLCDSYTGKIRYEGIVTCPDWDPDENRQCGGGLHLSPTPVDALRYNQGKLLECQVNIADFVVYAPDISKVRCRKVKVIGPVDEGGKE